MSKNKGTLIQHDKSIINNEYNVIKSLKGIKIRTSGEGITTETKVYAIEEEKVLSITQKTTAKYSGTPYKIITIKTEK